MISRSVWFLLFVLAAVPGCSHDGNLERRSLEVVSDSGFGPIEVGIPVAEVSRALGSPLEPVGEPTVVQVDCYFVEPPGLVGVVSFMVVGGVVVRVDIEGSGPTTRDGIGVGSPEREIHENYGERINVTPHPFMGPGSHYLSISLDGDRQILFETDGRTVLKYRAGLAPYTDWMEGCF